MPAKGFAHERPHEGATNDWITPRYIIEALQRGFHGPFDLDPCASLTQPWPTATRMLTIVDDGLHAPWDPGCSVYCNPPYGPHVSHWLARLSSHGNGVALIFARTETVAWQSYVFGTRPPYIKASAVLFLDGRVKFCLPNGKESKQTAGAPSALVAYGFSANRLRACGLRGGLVEIAGKP